MKKIIALALCLILCFSMMSITTFAAEGTDGSVTVSASKTNLEVGKTADITIKVNAKTDPLGSVNLTIALPAGLEYVSHQVLVSTSDYMMSNYNPTTGKFGCAVTSTGKTGQFNVLKITVKAKDTNLGANAITVTVGNMSKLDGATMMNFGSCEPLTITTATHFHTYGNTFNGKDAEYHWKECTATNCPNKTDSIKDKTEHSGGTATCVAQAVCYCGQSYGSVDANNHAYGTLVTKVDPIHTATELKAGKAAHYHCGCGKYFTEAKAEVNEADLVIAAPTHSYTTANGYKEADGHANTCTCGAKDTVVAHTSSGSATETTPETCTICGYVITPALGHTTHTAKSEWKSDADNHWHECTGCEGQQLEKAAHADTNNDEKCDTCGYDMPATGTDPNPGTTPEPGTTPGTDDPNTPDDPADDKDGLGAGAIIGIVVGVLAVLGGGGFALYWFVLRKKPILPTDPTTPIEEAPDTDTDDAEATDEDDSPETEDAPETEDKKDTE